MMQNGQAPTRSAIIQLREEHSVIMEAYNFLDEKRLLLAAELLRQLSRYEELLSKYDTLRLQAEQALINTVRRHGLQGAQIYPGDFLDDAHMQVKQSQFMGVPLVDTQLTPVEDTTPLHIAQKSPEAEHCRTVFLELSLLASRLAGVSGNLHRLFREYRKTERRARALENIVIPEVRQILKEITTQVEELEQEDIVRVHVNKR